MRSLLAIVGVAACGGGGQTPPADAPPDAFVLPPLTSQTFVMSEQRIPQTNNDARELALDLNGDATVDNGLGLTFGTFETQGIAMQAQATRAVDRGELIHLIRFGVNDAAGVGSFEIFEGETPIPAACTGAGDTTCRHHLDGSATFDVAPGTQHVPLIGELIGQQFTTPIGDGQLRLLTTINAGTLIPLDLFGARVKVSIGANGLDGVIAGAILQTDVESTLLPAWRLGFAAIVARDCTTTTPPDCGCPPGSQGDGVAGLFDVAPQDCAISLSEIQNNSLIQALLAPDVTIAGQDALSVGVGFTAVSAMFEP